MFDNKKKEKESVFHCLVSISCAISIMYREMTFVSLSSCCIKALVASIDAIASSFVSRVAAIVASEKSLAALEYASIACCGFAQYEYGHNTQFVTIVVLGRSPLEIADWMEVATSFWDSRNVDVISLIALMFCS
jgi:hypothetical protein